MILTVTPNAALDRLIFIDEFQPGARTRVERVAHAVGGKGICASVALCTFKVDTLALSFLAGSTGQQLLRLLDEYGARHDIIWIEGETRTIHVVVETRHHRHSHLITGALSVTEAAASELFLRYQHHLPQADWVVAGGTLAPGWPFTFYQELTHLAQAANKPILIDGSGPPLLNVVSARPTILKMNRTEFTQTFNTTAANLAELYAQAQALREREGLPAVVITCGEDGLLAVTPQGSFLAGAPVQPAVNAAGAGDTASGILAWRLAQGDSWPEALRWAAAAGAACVLTERTAESRREDVERILPQVAVQKLG
jgi:1-phosphofructokinase family hexose kinase